VRASKMFTKLWLSRKCVTWRRVRNVLKTAWIMYGPIRPVEFVAKARPVKPITSTGASVSDYA
jgi:hypothetical protein